MEVVMMEGMPHRVNAAVGAYGERVARAHLLATGRVLLDLNWRCEHGEIDIVAREGATLVICEVKTRRGTGFGGALEALTRAKQARLRRLAGAWLASHEGPWDDVRVDLLAVQVGRSGAAQVQHVEGVA